MLFKEIVDARTDGRTHGRTTDNGRRTLKDHKSSLSTSCSGELKSSPLLHGLFQITDTLITYAYNVLWKTYGILVCRCYRINPGTHHTPCGRVSHLHFCWMGQTHICRYQNTLQTFTGVTECLVSFALSFLCKSSIHTSAFLVLVKLT